MRKRFLPDFLFIGLTGADEANGHNKNGVFGQLKSLYAVITIFRSRPPVPDGVATKNIGGCLRDLSRKVA